MIGIDPGASGGIAVLGACGPPLSVVKMPETERDIADYLSQWKGPIVIEKVHASPQMGVTSAFKFGRSLGLLHMAAIASGMAVHWVTPQKWQAEFGLIVRGRKIGQGDTEKKNRNKARAQELFPGVRVTHAIADALLIAEWGRRNLR